MPPANYFTGNSWEKPARPPGFSAFRWLVMRRAGAKLWLGQLCYKNFWEIMGNAAVFGCELDIAVTLA